MTNFTITLEKIFTPKAYAARVARNEARWKAQCLYYDKCFAIDNLIEDYFMNECHSPASEADYQVTLRFTECSYDFSAEELDELMDICEKHGVCLQFEPEWGSHGFFVDYTSLYEEISL